MSLVNLPRSAGERFDMCVLYVAVEGRSLSGMVIALSL